MNIFKKITNWYLGNDDREREVPREGVPRIAYLAVNYTGRLIALNLIFILSCIPIVTIPSAITAMNRYLTKMFLDGFAFDFSDYFEEFKSNFVRKLVIGSAAGAIMFYGYYLMSLSGNFKGDISGAFFGIGAVVLMGGFLFGEVSLIIESMFRLDISCLLRDTFFIVFVLWRESLAAVIAAAAILFLSLTFMPYSIILYLSIFFSFTDMVFIGLFTPKLAKKDI
ncbi:MAG: DUF624 domain-containing protein [Lachnospiraceae bacterium]|nr:DUF624 domain-containing protein [Lachnospiraceae bacterium]